MTDTSDRRRANRRAKGAARAAIGKLIGDDAAVRDGRAEQRAAGGSIRPAAPSSEQE